MRTKRAIGGALAGLLLLTGTGALGHAWAVALGQDGQVEQGQTAQAVSLSATAASVVDADQMMEAAGLDGDVELGEYAGPVEGEDTDAQLWEPEAGVSLQSVEEGQDYVFLSDLDFDPTSRTQWGRFRPTRPPAAAPFS